MQDLKLFSGNANVALARSVVGYLDIDLRSKFLRMSAV